MHKLLLNLLGELRTLRGANFLYMPSNLSVYKIMQCIYLEYVDKDKSDMLIINKVLNELMGRVILASGGVEYHEYELDNYTFHDVSLTTSDNRVYSRGTSLDLSEAYAKAIGEVLERTSIKYNREDDNIRASNIDLVNLKYQGMHRVAPEDFAQPTEGQKVKYPMQDIREDDIFSHTQVRCLDDNLEYLMPSQAVHYRNADSYKKEKIIIAGSTHGAGAYYSIDGATESAVYEIVNRHYYLKSWYFKSVKRRLDVNSIPHYLVSYKLIKDLEYRDFKVNLVDYSDEAGLPSIICVLEKSGGWYVGGTAGNNLDRVILRSISEAFSSYLWSMSVCLTGRNDINLDKMNNIEKNFLDTDMGTTYYKILLFANKYYIDNVLDFKDFIKGEEVNYKELINVNNKSVKEIASRLPSKVYIKQVTNSYLDDYGYNVVKAIAPSAYNLHLDEVDARAVIDNHYPQNTEFNPFP